jgi:hypothetical protein
MLIYIGEPGELLTLVAKVLNFSIKILLRRMSQVTAGPGCIRIPNGSIGVNPRDPRKQDLPSSRLG